jgi:hypothetical protein
MQHADLSPSTQFLLVGFLAVAGAALLTRSIFFFRREYAGIIRPIYPSDWSAAQCRSLEYFRMLVGLVLITVWGSFLYLAPSMPTTWPFGYVETFILLMLLLISNAWVLLLGTWNWEKFGAISRSYSITITFLVVWWGATFTATGWMLAMASASPLVHLSGVYAAQSLPSLARPAN